MQLEEKLDEASILQVIEIFIVCSVLSPASPHINDSNIQQHFHPGTVGTTSIEGFQNGEANAKAKPSEDTMNEGQEQEPGRTGSNRLSLVIEYLSNDLTILMFVTAFFLPVLCSEGCK